MTRTYTVFLLALTACSATTSSKTSDSISTLENAKVKVSPQIDVDYTRERVIKTTTLNGTRARAWEALLDTHNTIGLTKAGSDPEAFTASFEGKGVRSVLSKPISSYVDCGRGAGNTSRADTYSISLLITQKLSAISDQQTQLATAISATARNRGLSSEAIECSSNGLLEQRIAELVSARLQ
ncbi:MAG TPA: hypothetical protein VM100_09590 [Longimicrobiales bacterium]|nr:hypothetical protein [Longimicrobiales bacterium]